MPIRVFSLIFLNFFCNANNIAPTTEEIIAFLKNKNDKDSLIMGVYYAGETKDSFFIKLILDNAYDPRISHNKKFYGMSIHQSCMIALSKITGNSPPNNISYKVDENNIKFYLDRKR